MRAVCSSGRGTGEGGAFLSNFFVKSLSGILRMLAGLGIRLKLFLYSPALSRPFWGMLGIGLSSEASTLKLLRIATVKHLFMRDNLSITSMPGHSS